MECLPVIIPTLNRTEGLIRCIESLKRCTNSEIIDVFIGVDYPKYDQHWKGYNEILDYLSNEFVPFNSFNVIKRDKNLGAIANFEQLLEMVFKKYDRCVCLFDDLEVSQNFIEYMQKMLDLYVNDQSVIAVTGYSYPIKWKVNENCNVVKQNYVASIWGIGYWRKKYYIMKSDFRAAKLINKFPLMQKNDFPNMTDWAIKDYVNCVAFGVAGKSFLKQVTDIAMRIYLAVEDKYVIMPLESKVRNYGFDGSGAYCEKIESDSQGLYISQNYSFNLQPIDMSTRFVPSIDSQFDNRINREIMNSFDYVEPEMLCALRDRAEYYTELGLLGRKMLNAKRLLAKIFHKFT